MRTLILPSAMASSSIVQVEQGLYSPEQREVPCRHEYWSKWRLDEEMSRQGTEERSLFRSMDTSFMIVNGRRACTALLRAGAYILITNEL
jgi:hypothetical protein